MPLNIRNAVVLILLVVNTFTAGLTRVIVFMTDSYGDGWNHNVLAIRQKNLTQTFGEGFMNGSFAGPIDIFVEGSIDAEVIVHKFGLST